MKKIDQMNPELAVTCKIEASYSGSGLTFDKLM